jgi:hypothetical protein
MTATYRRVNNSKSRLRIGKDYGQNPGRSRVVDGYAAGGRAAQCCPTDERDSLISRYERESRAVAQMTGTEPATEAKFIADYMRIVGIDPVSDDEMPHRSDPGTETLLQRLSADNMRFRDEHLLSTILKQLDGNDRVLIVYGSSHWTTLSRALQDRLGKPVIVIKETIEQLRRSSVSKSVGMSIP